MRRIDRSPKLKDPLRVIGCGNCQRLIDFMDKPGHAPADADPALLHPIFLPNPPRYSVLCSCGHYTFYVDDRERDQYEAKAAANAAATAAANAAGKPSRNGRDHESDASAKEAKDKDPVD